MESTALSLPKAVGGAMPHATFPLKQKQARHVDYIFQRRGIRRRWRAAASEHDHLVVKRNGGWEHRELAVGAQQALSSCAHRALYGKHGLHFDGHFRGTAASAATCK